MSKVNTTKQMNNLVFCQKKKYNSYRKILKIPFKVYNFLTNFFKINLIIELTFGFNIFKIFLIIVKKLREKLLLT